MRTIRELETNLKQYAPPYYEALPFVPVIAKGEWIYARVKNENGKESFRSLLDFHGNFSAIGLGHNHREIVELKIKRLQKNKPALISVGEAIIGEFIEFAEKLTALSGMDMVVAKNAGTEVFDSAFKAARLWGYKVKGVPRSEAEIIVARDNFHGRSFIATAASTSAIRREGFGPFIPSLIEVPFGDAKALEQKLHRNTVAVILEPIQAEAGVIVPPSGYLRQVRKLCNEKHVLFILDEIQTGMGRTGKLFCWQHEGEEARPDCLMLGKLLGGGSNIISALLLKKEIGELLKLGMEGSTFGGNDEACAVASKTLDILCRRGFLERVNLLGEEFMEGLRAISSPLIKEVRGRGLLVAIELVPEAGGAKRIQAALLQRGDIVSLARGEHVIGFSPPLTIRKRNLLRFGLNRIEKALKEIEGSTAKWE